MRIGRFAKENGLSADTVRYYIGQKLLMPTKKNAYYDFDEHDQKEMTWISSLKVMGFKLKEIREILRMLRLGLESDKKEKAYLLMILQKRLQGVEKEQKHLETVRMMLNQRILEIETLEVEVDKILGFQVSMLSELYCHTCQHSFELEEGIIEKGCIKKGLLVCLCGHCLEVDDGIVIGEHNFVNRHLNESLHLESIYEDFISTTDSNYLDQIYTSMQWFGHRIKSEERIIEFGTGSGFLLNYLKSYLKPSQLYVAVDHDLERLHCLKRNLEQSDIACRVLFICSDFKSVPLRKEGSDVVLDFFGTMTYALDNTDAILSEMISFLKKDGICVLS